MLILREIVHQCMNILPILLLLTFLTSTPQWRTMARAQLCPTRAAAIGCSSYSVSARIVSVRNVHGTQLAFHADQERDMYFRQLTNAWAK